MKIEKNIEMPNRNTHKLNRDEIYETIFAMEVGDSVFFSIYEDAVKLRGRAQGYLRNKNLHEFNHEFALRSVEEKKGSGWRVWRIK